MFSRMIFIFRFRFHCLSYHSTALCPLSLGCSRCLHLKIPLTIQPPRKQKIIAMIPFQCPQWKPIKPMHPSTPNPIRAPGSKSGAWSRNNLKAYQVRHRKMNVHAPLIRESRWSWYILSMLRMFCKIKRKMWNAGSSAIPKLPSSGISRVMIMVKKFLTFRSASSTISCVSCVFQVLLRKWYQFRICFIPIMFALFPIFFVICCSILLEHFKAIFYLIWNLLFWNKKR